ncbi:hypothetical protein LTR62_002198 [Meristemomyces frigidus]|uniref:Chitin-binding type-1 domain-containing protein n=1 Tax=Meristemomyces frigidus TaxID=1508187 RepID=A0AAN7TKV6_9PEZI|nr:hypothetical protein LTR62_002198 [Meristemomyces frigidus]
MKLSILATTARTTTTLANIIFPFVQPTCDFAALGSPGCLRGQECLENNTCIAGSQTRTRDLPPRDDGRCGSAFGGATCDPSGAYGGCCSQAGWCGNTALHCLVSDGCQSGCSASSAAASASTVPLSEPVIVPASSTFGGAAATGAVTTDGSCGAGNGGTVCGGWSLGGCCSMYGFCGKTSAHCGEGCQSGPCNQAPVVPAPGPSPAPANALPGTFKQVGNSGVPAMHAALLPNGHVVFLDKIENITNAKLPNGEYAYSTAYNPETNTFIPLAYKTNAFCSGGSFLPDGTLLNIGGNAPLTWLDPTIGNGFQAIRYLQRSATDSSLDAQPWSEPGNQLNTARWYPSCQTLPDGSIFVASGSLNGLDPSKFYNNNPTYEILNAQGITSGESIPMDLLVKAQPYYMYPFIHLLPDGTLFVFASKSSDIFDVAGNETVKSLPDLPGDYRTYPNTGGSVLLPLSPSNAWTPEILICGGGAWQGIDSPTDPSCGRISPLSPAANWELDSMPSPRTMAEGILLPDGTVLWLNGAAEGAEGFNQARSPATQAWLYDPSAALGARWTTGASSAIPRLYHSVALLLLDGTVLIAGSNPDEMPVVAPAEDPQGFKTEFTVEVYTPPYLSSEKAGRRPGEIAPSTLHLRAEEGFTFTIAFTCPAGAEKVKIALYHGGFVTHAVHMSQRMLFLDSTGWQAGDTQQKVTVTMAPDGNLAPPGPYVVFVVVDGVPGVGQSVMVS